MNSLQSSSKTAEIEVTVRKAVTGPGAIVDASALVAKLLEYPRSTPNELAASLGIEVFGAHVRDVRVSGNRVYVSSKARERRRQWLIAQGIAHWALDRHGDVQTPATPIAALLAPAAAPKKAVRRAA